MRRRVSHRFSSLQLHPGRWLAAAALAVVSVGCGLEVEGVPQGKVAVVGDTVFGPEDLSAVQAQLGAYAQLRFRGAEGRSGLLEALVTAELLAQEAIDDGLGEDPRVHWALLEEVATLHESAEMERRVPRADVAADKAALDAYYDAHPDEFTNPERRVAQGVVFRKFDEAEGALRRVRSGEATMESLGEVVATPPQIRDGEHPGFHEHLFAADLRPGDWLAHPVVVGEFLLVARVKSIEPAHRQPRTDPSVQERLVEAVRGPRVQRARTAWLAELARAHPSVPVP